MDAVQFLKIKAKLCDGYCVDCPLSYNNNGTGIGCREFINSIPEKAVELLEKWAKEHPQKTYMQDLMEKFPNMALNDVGIPYPCRAYLYNKSGRCIHHNGSCAECWNEPMEV